MKYLFFLIFIAFSFIAFAFSKTNTAKNVNNFIVQTSDSSNTNNSIIDENIPSDIVSTNVTLQAQEFVEYAKTFTGTPYLYGSTDPSKGLDCSGFINVVSKHFGIKVPRSSVEFTNVGETIGYSNAKPGDLILFTGTDPNKRVVGHIGIITNNIDGHIQFIHSSSGKANGVTTSDLDKYYQSRFVKVVRIFPIQAEKLA